MKENPRHVDSFNNLVDEGHPEVTLTTHAKIVKIQNTGGATLYGILMNKSIIFPFTASPNTDEGIKNIVRLNTMDLVRKPDEPHSEAACRLMGLHFNGLNSGFYSDGTAIPRSNIMALHIYPGGFIETQDEFIQKVNKMFMEKDITMTFEESSA